MRDSNSTRLDIIAFMERLSDLREEDLLKFLQLLAEHQQSWEQKAALSELERDELRRLRNDSDGLREDFTSLQEDAAEVIRQWGCGSTGQVDEAIGKLMANGRTNWWMKK